jgi:hypothetical protein
MGSINGGKFLNRVNNYQPLNELVGWMITLSYLLQFTVESAEVRLPAPTLWHICCTLTS